MVIQRTPPRTKISPPLGFTLVELIVVITILVILGTIAFVQLGGFAGSARDATRISDLANISKGLDTSITRNGIIPAPELGTNAGIISITLSGVNIGSQGAIGTNILSMIRMNGEGKDPLDKKSYTYITNTNSTKYQLLALFEDSSTSLTATIPYIDTAFAGYETRTPGVKGRQLGVLLGNTGTLINQPVQENYSSSFTGVDIATTTGSYITIFDNKRNITGTGTKLRSLYTNFIGNDPLSSIAPGIDENSLAGYWDMEATIGGKLADLSGNGGDGTLYNTSSSNGKRGRATRFTRGSPMTTIVLPGGGNLQNVTDNSFTFLSWVYPTQIPSGTNNTLATIIGRPGFHTYLSYTSGKRIMFGIYNSSNINITLSPLTILNINEWHQVAGTIDTTSSIMSIYIDGALSGTGLFTGTLKDYGTTNYIIGSSSTTSCAIDWAFCFDGLIDETRIYNRALSASEIQSLYNMTK